MTILEILNQIAATSKKTEKEAILKANADNETLKRVFYLAYQPTLNFYTKRIPAYTPNTGEKTIFDDEDTFTLDAALDSIVGVLAKRVLTGSAAASHLANLLTQLHADDATVLERVVLRDLRIDAGANTANKVWKGLILDVPYMRCSLPKEVKLATFPWVTGLYSQLKSDGSFTNVNVYPDGAVEFMTRNGNVYPTEDFQEVELAFRQTEKPTVGYQFHGELLVYKDGELMERAEGNGVLNKIQQGKNKLPAGHTIRFVAWDMIPIEAAVPKGKYEVPYAVRLEQLESLGLTGAVEVVQTRVVHSIREAYEHYQEQLALGLEGTILKDPSAIWEDTTSKKQVKFKMEVTIELECVGFNPGKGKNANTFGSAKLRSSDGLLTVNCSGFKDADRKYISENRDDFINTIWAVTSNAMTKKRADGTRSLFLPRYVEQRNDKDEADSLERIELQFESAVNDLEALIAM
jgi:DNA ligase-1